MKKIGFLILFSAMFFSVNQFAHAEGVTEYEPKSGLEWKLVDEVTVDLSTYEENDINDSNEDYFTNPLSLPHYEHDGGGGSFYSPSQIHTSLLQIENSGVYIEYTIKDGKLVFFEREGLFYDYQNWTQSYLNAVTGTIVGTFASGYISRLTYKVSNKVPYLKTILNKNGTQVKDYGSYVTAAGVMTFYSLPVFSKITYNPVPTVGSRESVIYVSKTGASGTWNYRARFVLSGQSLSVSTWVVN